MRKICNPSIVSFGKEVIFDPGWKNASPGNYREAIIISKKIIVIKRATEQRIQHRYPRYFKINAGMEDETNKRERGRHAFASDLSTNILVSFIISTGYPLGPWHAGIHESKQD